MDTPCIPPSFHKAGLAKRFSLEGNHRAKFYIHRFLRDPHIGVHSLRVFSLLTGHRLLISRDMSQHQL